MEPDVRYCTTEDGVRIAYTTSGEGLPVVVCPFFIESFAFDGLVPEVVEFLSRLDRGRRLIRYDARGTGLSEVNLEFSQGSFLGDLSAVVNACGVEHFVLWASGTAGPGAIEFVATHPDRVSHLILFNTFARLNAVMDRAALQAMASLAEANWPLAAQTFADMTLRREFPDAALRWSEVFRRSASGETIARGLRSGDPDLDVTMLLGKIRAHTLVFHRREGSIAPLEEGRKMAMAIPGALFVPLEGSAAHYSLGDTQTVLEAVDAFLGDRPARSGESRRLASPPQAPASTAVILFTDIAGSTAHTERMGDAAFRAAARALDVALRQAVRDAGGTLIEAKTLGDGILATFASAAQALDAARRCLGLSAESELGLHIGLHAGDVIPEEGNVYGGAVNIAARISALSAPGEVLVSRTIADLARTSAGVAFEDRGEHALKGIADPVRVYAVRAADRS